MELKAVFPLCIFLLFSLVSLSAQKVSTSSDFSLSIVEEIISTHTDLEWTFLEDIEDQKVYIDLAELGGNFAELIVLDADEKEVYKEDLFDLPSDSIYELDLSNLGKGDYTIELKTYNQPIYRSISVK